MTENQKRIRNWRFVFPFEGEEVTYDHDGNYFFGQGMARTRAWINGWCKAYEVLEDGEPLLVFWYVSSGSPYSVISKAVS